MTDVDIDLEVLIDEPMDAYLERAGEYLTSHQLKDFRQSPLLYYRKVTGLAPEPDDRPAFLVGRAAHTLILEGRAAYEAGYAVGGPVNPKTGEVYGSRTKAFAEWAEREGKPVLTSSQADLVEELNAAVRAHEAAVELLADGVAEGVVRADYRDLACQSRIDWLHPERGIVDLKTCDDLAWFESDARRYGYLHQMAFYQAVLEQAVGNLTDIPVHILAVEKKEPYRCGAWRLAPDVLKYARRENEEAMDRLKQCRATDTWPTGYGEVRTFDYL